MLSPSEALRLHGTEELPAEPRRLVAGRLSCSFEDGALRHVRWGDVEIVRGIAYLLRDRDWGTVPARMSGLVIEESAAGFKLEFNLRMGALDAAARIEGDAHGQLSFVVEATAEQAIQTNRCGFVVLHPAHAAGSALSVEHTDGSIDETMFPRQISPSQPVLDILCLRYSPADGLSLECRLDAELPHDPAGKFEMEDQRNWSDASFKTYVASLLDPWPYVLPAARTLAQRVTLTVKDTAVRTESIDVPADDERREIGLATIGTHRLPQIGIGIPPGLHRAHPAEHAAMRELGAAWWILDATLADPALYDDLAAAATLRSGLAVRLQVDLVVPAHATPEAAARQAAEACARAALTVDAVRLLPEPYLKSYQPSATWPDLPPLEAYAQAARRHFPGASIGGGMFTNFTELNRKRPHADGLDFIGHATCPIVHAADDALVMETVESLPAIAHSVRSLWPALRYRLGPSTLAAHRNPYGDGPAANSERRRIALAEVDPRHRGQFAAAWTLAYAAAVAAEGLEVLALHHGHGTSGPFGIADAAEIDEQPQVLCWSVLRTLAAAAGATRVPLHGLGPDLGGLAWSHDGAAIDALVANLGAREVRVACPGMQPASVLLGPYATAAIHRAVPP